MKHCHFSILWNELPFLKQKMKFLYDNFDQLIFYDLNIKTLKYSDDGSHEFIKEYPDPKNKIILIEKRDLSDVNKYRGSSFVEKQKMFAVGSRHVRDDMDVFWCDDMDEFFNKSLIKRVEDIYKNNKKGTIMVPHIIYFKSQDFIYCEKNGKPIHFSLARITRHKKGNLYGHCNLQQQYTPLLNGVGEYIHHFAYVGEDRVKLKVKLYAKYTPTMAKFYNKVWTKFDPSKVGDGVYGHPDMHPGKPWGIKRHNHAAPEYIDVKTMMKDLG